MISKVSPYLTLCVSRNTPELVERVRRGYESLRAHSWLYLKNKNQCTFMVQKSVIGIVVIEMQTKIADVSNTGKLP